MMTKQNMMHAARTTMDDADDAACGSAQQYEAAVAALGFACMLIGAAQEPWDQPMVDEGWRLKRNAETLLQSCVGAQCDEHYASGKRDGEAKVTRDMNRLFDGYGV